MDNLKLKVLILLVLFSLPALAGTPTAELISVCQKYIHKIFVDSLSRKIRNNGSELVWRTDRGLLEAVSLFEGPLVREINKLNSQDRILIMGSGDGNLERDLFSTDLKKENFRQWFYFDDHAPAYFKLKEKDENELMAFLNRHPADRPWVYGIAYISENEKRVLPSKAYIETGHLFEEIPEHDIPHGKVLIDLWGIGNYTYDLYGTLTKDFNALELDGVAFIYPADLSGVEIKMGHGTISLPEFLAQHDGLEVTVYRTSVAEHDALMVRKTKNNVTLRKFELQSWQIPRRGGGPQPRKHKTIDKIPST